MSANGLIVQHFPDKGVVTVLTRLEMENEVENPIDVLNLFVQRLQMICLRAMEALYQVPLHIDAQIGIVQYCSLAREAQLLQEMSQAAAPAGQRGMAGSRRGWTAELEDGAAGRRG